MYWQLQLRNSRYGRSFCILEAQTNFTETNQPRDYSSRLFSQFVIRTYIPCSGQTCTPPPPFRSRSLSFRAARESIWNINSIYSILVSFRSVKKAWTARTCVSFISKFPLGYETIQLKPWLICGKACGRPVELVVREIIACSRLSDSGEDAKV